MRSPVPNREVFRLAPPLIFWWVWLAFAVANVADFALQGAPTRLAIVVSAILVTITGLAFTLALRPRVIAEQSGLTIVNPFRAHHVPWAAITAVDTGEWVQVHYAPGAAADKPASSASGRAVSCWALYISARTKRRAAKLARAGPLGAASFDRANLPAGSGQGPRYAENSRLPEEAKYLASLPAAKAIAVRLDTRAARERARTGPDRENPVTARWAWPPIAAVALPALALLIIVLA